MMEGDQLVAFLILEAAMHDHDYDPECKGCRPAVIDPETRLILPEDHPIMKLVMSVWAEFPHHMRASFMRVTAKNSRDPTDLVAVEEFNKRLQEAEAERRKLKDAN